MPALLVALLLPLLLLLFFSRQKQAGRKYPRSLPSLPIIGSLLSLYNSEHPHLILRDLQKKYGSTFSLWMGSQYTVVINHHLPAKEVLLKKGKDFAGRPSLVTTNILSQDGKDIAFSNFGPMWKQQRKLVQSAFAMFKDGSLHVEKIVNQQAAFLCKLLAERQGTSFDFSREIFLVVSNVVSHLCFNSCFELGDPELDQLLMNSEHIINTIAKDSLVDIFPWLRVFPNKELRLLKKSVEIRNKLLKKRFKDHQEKFSSESIVDLLDVLLRAKMNMDNNNSRMPQEPSMTDDHVIMTIGDIFGAGVETTSSVLKWFIAFLLHYPQVKKKIQEEIDRKIGFSRTPALSDRNQLIYLEASIREILRIRPVTPLLIPHIAMKDSSIGEYTIHKGTRIMINIWSLHHDEMEWRNPDRFEPDRFLDKKGEQLISPSSSYLPFGTGPRVCLGESLARIELFLFLAWILQRFDFEVPENGEKPNLEGKTGVVYQVLPFQVVVKLRKGWMGTEVRE
ncbi:steroid 17-alpha-hydroxylase/17,20 lyase [Ornithorhynchus anatinus]|uniref:steroid 17-alpha-hydroxylase/17,20 lyase n=1 Tax=Ornithorhynchus anatinus TaxID=9258 RepID=UPI0010A847EB|nr:steroid 17-alpha-hydroxylase/17,20 lyase [Ornithorhynchus anatinus]